MELRQPSIPDGLLAALERQGRYLGYTNAKTVYSCVTPDYREVYVGVFGDGANGVYEWFIWDADAQTLRTSDNGYGCNGTALCSGLVEAKTSKANGDHDLFLTWTRITEEAN